MWAVSGLMPHHLRMIDRGDEGEHAADRRQIQVAARLVRLRLDGELDVVALAENVVAQEVDGLAEPLGRLDRILAGVDLDAFAAAPEDEHLRAQVGGHVDGAHHLLRGVQPDGRVGAGEGAVLEDGMIERVGRGHRGLDAPVADGFLHVAEDLIALGGAGGEGEDVVVVKLEAVAVALRQSLDALQGGQFRPGLIAERIAAAVLQTPDAKGELVFFRRSVNVRRHGGFLR